MGKDKKLRKRAREESLPVVEPEVKRRNTDKAEQKAEKKLAKKEKKAKESKDKESSKSSKKDKSKKSKSSNLSTDDNSAPLDSSTSFLPPTDAKDWKKSNCVVISGKDQEGRANRIAKDFSCLNCSELQSKGEQLGWRPTPIQAASWPIVMAGDDLVAIAETGSGKTLGFGLPVLSRMKMNGHLNPSAAPRLLILAPTRELAQQSHEVLLEWGTAIGFTSALIVGGTNRGEQIRRYKRESPLAVVGTPGRMADLMNDGVIDGHCLSYLILDEADRMLDKGFLPTVRTIFEHCSEQRQTIMFSATWPEEVQKLSKELLNSPTQVFVGFEDAVVDEDGEVATTGEKSTNCRIVQRIEVIGEYDRLNRLKALMKEFQHHASKDNRILIFVLYKKEAPRVEEALQREGYRCASIHGDKPQHERERVLAEFKAHKVPIMIATDVAARGLDIPDVEVVMNFSFPLTIEDYVHRIGRTGRGGKSGLAHTFFHAGNKDLAGELQACLRSVGQESAITPELAAFGGYIKRKKHPLYGDIGPSDDRPMKKAVHIKFD